MSAFAEELCRLALQNYTQTPGVMYGPGRDLALGAGVFFKDVVFASYISEQGRFRAQQGVVLVLTHECDVDQSNDRDFNEHVVCAPLIFIEEFAQTYENAAQMQDARSLIVNISKGNVNRLYYLPPTSPLIEIPQLKLGALVYLNAICSSHLKQFGNIDDNRLCALSSHGLEFADRMLQRHFLRPKVDTLAVLK